MEKAVAGRQKEEEANVAKEARMEGVMAKRTKRNPRYQ